MWACLFERGGFLGLGHLSLLAFLYQRAGGVQRIVCNFILVRGQLLLLLDNGQSATNCQWSI